MSDLNTGDFTQVLRTPDIRMVGLKLDAWAISRPFRVDITDTRRAHFYHVKQGAAWFRTGPGADELHCIEAGMSVGVEGHRHEWFDQTHLHAADLQRYRAHHAGPGKHIAQPAAPLTLFVASVDRSAAVLQRLPHGAIIVPANADGFSQMIAGCVALIEINLAQAEPDMGVARRLGEIIMLQLVGYARMHLLRSIARAPDFAHDEFILRAMIAFLERPGDPWTIARLAQAAGLSRSAFSERFKRAFDDTPLRALNRLRLHQAQDMLGQSNASLGDIAALVGFGSATAFLRAYKREFGISPGRSRLAARAPGARNPDFL